MSNKKTYKYDKTIKEVVPLPIKYLKEKLILIEKHFLIYLEFICKSFLYDKIL